MTDEEIAEQFAATISGLETTCSLLSAKDKSHAYRLGRYEGFLAGLKAGRPKWHKVADGDLPKWNCENILLYNKDHFCVTHSYSLGYYENGIFYNDCEMEEDTIAWCEIPLYEEE